MNAPRFPFVRCATLGLIVLAMLTLTACSDSVDYTAHDITGIMPDLSFNLTDENGDPANAGDYAGAPLTLVFFGYTNCPDICPMTLAHISSTLAGLDASVRDKVKVLFVSVDPKRDTPARLQAYTAHFGPQFIGLTGTQKQLTKFTKAMRITYGYGEPDANGFYLVSHSSAIFVFDNNQHVRLLFNQDETVDEMTADLQTLLQQTT